MISDCASPTPIGPPQAPSPLTPATLPIQEMMGLRLDKSHQPKTPIPIGGERTHRKGTGSMMGPEYGNQLLGFQQGNLFQSLNLS